MKEETLVKLRQLYEAELGKGPFPLKQVREVGKGKDYDYFHGHLDHWLADIAGIASHGKRLNKISAERKSEFRQLAAQPFFTEHPQFRRIQERISKSDVPDLKRLMESTETARLLILEVFAEEDTPRN